MVGKVYGVTEIARLLGVNPQTIRRWSDISLIPTGSRMGLKNQRAWNRYQVAEILTFARDLGYGVPETTIDHFKCN